MIPKIIHYCWFGDNSLSDLEIKCIDSWKKLMPDYEIRRWDESNFDINICTYVKEAYEAKKWAFVSDFARVYILYNYGGVYFDTDVELLMSIDNIIRNGSFLGRESTNPKLGIAPGLGMAAEPKMEFYKMILDDYYSDTFIKSDKTLNLYSIVDRFTDVLKNNGVSPLDEIQTIYNINIYPQEYFCPLNHETGELSITDKTVSIHWYNASWFDERMKRRKDLTLKIRKKVPGRLGKLICFIYIKFSYFLENLLKGKYFRIIKDKLSK